MMREIKVPRLAESISEAVVVAWLKPEGAAVAVDEPVVTLETDKAAVEIPSEYAGRLQHARAIGDRVQVGDVLARVEEGAAAAEGAAALPAPASATAPAAPAAAAAATPVAGGPVPGAERPLSPAVRRMVEEHGIDPAGIAGTGPRGRVLKEDVQRAIDRPAAAPMPPSVAPPRTVAPAPRPASAPPPAAAPPRPAPARVPGPDPAAVAPAFAPARAPSDWGVGESERAVPMSRIRQRI